MRKFLEYLDQGYIEVVETTRQVFKNSHLLAAAHHLDYTKLWDDPVLVSQMKRLNISEIYSNDADFDKNPTAKENPPKTRTKTLENA